MSEDKLGQDDPRQFRRDAEDLIPRNENLLKTIPSAINDTAQRMETLFWGSVLGIVIGCSLAYLAVQSGEPLLAIVLILVIGIGIGVLIGRVTEYLLNRDVHQGSKRVKLASLAEDEANHKANKDEANVRSAAARTEQLKEERNQKEITTPDEGKPEASQTKADDEYELPKNLVDGSESDEEDETGYDDDEDKPTVPPIQK